MEFPFNAMLEGQAVWILAIVVTVTFFGTLILVPWLILRIPEDYFSHERRERILVRTVHPTLNLLLLVVKNLFGLVILLAGVAMLFLPGQGVLTILVGLFMLDFPGKYRCERWLACRGSVLSTLNWWRAKRGRPALLIDCRPDGERDESGEGPA